MSRLSRYLIDKVDERLGDVEKEKKFDIIMIIVGVILLLSGLALTSLLGNDSKYAAIGGVVLSMIGLAFIYVMTKEYIDDSKKAKRG